MLTGCRPACYDPNALNLDLILPQGPGPVCVMGIVSKSSVFVAVSTYPKVPNNPELTPIFSSFTA